eukprot:COSAG03_NODE_4107_length_1682_cov_3.004422_2_plen_106_part_00
MTKPDILHSLCGTLSLWHPLCERGRGDRAVETPREELQAAPPTAPADLWISRFVAKSTVNVCQPCVPYRRVSQSAPQNAIGPRLQCRLGYALRASFPRQERPAKE